MKARDILTVASPAQDTGQAPHYAVKLPLYKFGRRDGSGVVEAVIGAVGGGKVYGFVCGRPGGAWDQGGNAFSAPLSAVLSTWAEHELSQAHDAALAEDRRREQSAAYEAKRQAVQDDVEGWVHLFAGIPTSDDRFASLEDTIHDYFVGSGSATITLHLDDVRGIAERIAAFQKIALEASEGWVASPAQDTGQTEWVTLAPRDDSALDRLRDVVARASGEAV